MNKTIKRNVVISAILAIMLCVSLIAGATFALFTSESKVNIAVTSGKVDVVATVENEKLSSTLGNNVAETSVTYNANENTITLDKIVPGDVVSFDIRVHNNSNVAVKYRTIIMCEKDNGLFSGLKVSIDKEEYKGRTSISEYADLAVDAEDQIIPVVITLPEEAGNKYQDKTCVISYKVEAIQGNANIEPTPKNVFEVYNAFDWMSFVEQADNGTLDSAIDTVKFINNIDLDGIEYGAYYFALNMAFTIDGNNCTINNLNTTASRNLNGFDCSGLFACISGSGSLSVNDLTIKNATVHGNESAASTAGVFIGQTRAAISFDNCHVVNSSATNDYAAGFIGYAEDHNGKNIAIKNGSSVESSEFNGNNATAALIALANANIVFDIDNVTVKDNTVNGGNGYSAAALVGTAFGSFKASNVTLANNTFAMNEGNTNYKGDHKDIGYFHCANLYEVNGVPYTTSLEQFSAAVNGTYAKVVLAADITDESIHSNLGGQDTYLCTITSSKNLTIDLDGHTFTTTNRLFEVYGNLTLMSSVAGGKIVGTSNFGSAYLIYVKESGTLKIENGIEIDVAQKQFAQYYGLKAIVNNGTVIMNGGKISVRNAVAVYNGEYDNGQRGAFTMNGGEISLMSDKRGNGDVAKGTCSGTSVTLNGGKMTGVGKAYVFYDEYGASVSNPSDSYTRGTIESGFINEVVD